jgi:thiol-disulfide isomerase/thioredoxin
MVHTVMAQSVATDWYSIKGFLPEWKGAIIELTIDGRYIKRDTIHTDMYSHTGKITGIKEGQLRFTKGKKHTFLSFFIEPGTIKIRDEKQQLVVYGTPGNDRYAQVTREIDSIALLQKQWRLDVIKNYKRGLAVVYIQQHPSSMVSMRLLADYFHLDTSSDDTLYYRLYHLLDSTLQASYTGKKLYPELKQRNAIANGRVLPLLQLTDSTKNWLPIYEKGKYSLINFWASWCLPCKREHPKLAQVFRQYQPQGFTIVSISLDTNRSAWINAMRIEKLEWTQLTDLKGWDGPVTKFFGVKLIPFNVLIDPNGTILAKNVSAEDIEQLLTNKAGFPKFTGPL